MCGFAGIAHHLHHPAADTVEAALRRMMSRLVHRGPDDSGVWLSARSQVGLAFRRLAIQDLSSDGHQPMSSSSGRFTIAFNGEIYNFKRLRQDLERCGHRFRGGSDTEVVLECFERWGVIESLPRFIGMFAFAVWDSGTERLHLGRDRFGVKPLYVGSTGRPIRSPEGIRVGAGETLLFASELKAIHAFPKFTPSIDRESLAEFMHYGYVPDPRSIWSGIGKVEPGTCLVFDPRSGVGTKHVWWSARQATLDGLEDPLAGDEDAAVDELESILDDAIGLRMISDVPLGAFLSGGVDSSVVVARMAAIDGRKVRTFAIGFEDPRYDESTHAQTVADHLGTDHETRLVSSSEVLDVVPSLPDIWDEPFADPSEIPTAILCREARRSMKVVLSGDGGDEFFGGYRQYDQLPAMWRRVRRVPRFIRNRLGRSAVGDAGAAQPVWMRIAGARGTRRLQTMVLGSTIGKLAPYLTAEDEIDCQHRYMTFWDGTGGTSVVEGCPARRGHAPESWRLGSGDVRTRMRYADSVNYLPGDVLCKVDRASMAVGLEAREPLLDHRLYEFSARIPAEWQTRNGQSRWLLRRVLYRSVPESVINRPKQGFTPPIGKWLMGPLREWASDLLSFDRLKRLGHLDADRVHRSWMEFSSGRGRVSYMQIWTAVVFQAWWDRWHGGSST